MIFDRLRHFYPDSSLGHWRNVMSNRILVIDDEKNWCDTFRDILIGENYEVDIAGNPKDALTLLNSNWYDLVLFDICLDQRGFTLDCQHFCDSLTRRYHLPVVAVTGKAIAPPEVWNLHQLRVIDFIYKPQIDLQNFRRRIRIAIDKFAEDDSFFDNFLNNRKQIEDRFANLRGELNKIDLESGKRIIALIDEFEKILDSKDISKMQKLWNEIKEGIKTSGAATAIILAIKTLLGF